MTDPERSKVLVISNMEEASVATKFEGLTVWEFCTNHSFCLRNMSIMADLAATFPHDTVRFVRINAATFKWNVETPFVGVNDFPTYYFSRNGAELGNFVHKHTLSALSVAKAFQFDTVGDTHFQQLRVYIENKLHGTIALLL